MEHVSDPHQSTYMLQHAIEEWQHVRLFIFPCRISTAIVHLKDEQVSHYLTVVELSRPSKLSNLLDKPMFAYPRKSLAQHKDQLHALQVLNLGSPLKKLNVESCNQTNSCDLSEDNSAKQKPVE